MRVLVDIAHPAHVHFFRHAIHRWLAAGHQVLITSRDKDLTYTLLDEFGLPHQKLGAARKGMMGLGIELAQRSWAIHRWVGRFRPDVGVAIAGTFLVYGCYPHRVPTVVFTDTEHARFGNRITFPLATAIVTPRAYTDNVGPKQVRYNGYHELAYTHRSVFTPNPEYLTVEGLEKGEPFVLVRLVNWQASHDVGDYGIRDLHKIVRVLSRYGRVILSSEAPLPADLQSLQLRGPRKNMLHLQAFARLLFGESATMASECAMLGTPAIFVSTSRRGYIDEQQSRYGMTFSFNDPVHGQDQALEKAVELLEDPEVPALWQAKREKMLAELIDVNDFILDIVGRYAAKSK